MRRSALAPLALTLLTLLPAAARAGEASEEAAARLLKDRMANERPRDAALLAGVDGRDVVVVAGSMDRVQQVLRRSSIPHTVIAPARVHAFDFNNDQIVMVNCPGEIGPKGREKLEKFVRAGGTLYTTDWSLRNVVQKTFPGTIRWNGRETDDHVVPVEVMENGDELMNGMLLRKDGQPQWWLEGGSYPVKILDPEKVEVLASSRRMQQRYGSAPVVVRFRWHDGQVIHVVSHFYRQLSTQGPMVAAASAVDGYGGLTAAQKKAFKASAGGRVKAGDVESSYAFQQMTTNLVVTKQKQNEDLDRLYDMTPRAEVELEGRKVKKGDRVRILSRKGGTVRVRDDRGNEAELPAAALEMR
ncbi:MAG: hypothetical protein P1V51_13715 [Deltaproteobacteria bacterium]|nr:hypothetical protein [Deltaproteobacteria bacterium]